MSSRETRPPPPTVPPRHGSLAPSKQKNPPPPPPPSSSSKKEQKSPSAATTSDDHHLAESELPSCTKSGFTAEKERSFRLRTCRFIQEASRKLSLDLTATATTMVIFHRFYAVHSFSDHDRFEVAMACLLLAAKTEECGRKLNHVIREAWRLKNMAARVGRGGKSSSSELGNGTSNNVDKKGYLNEKSEEFIRLKEKILLLERVVLHTIGFELSIDHPYKLILAQIKRWFPVDKMVPSRHVEYINPPAPPTDPAERRNFTKEKNKNLQGKLTRSAVDFATDSLHTTLCLKYSPKKVALTCVYMSAQYCEVQPTEGRTWLQVLDSDGTFVLDELASIAVQIMELIADKKGVDMEIFESIRKNLMQMKTGGGGEKRPPNIEKGMNRPTKRQHV